MQTIKPSTSLHIPLIIEQKIDAYINAVDGEISGMGKLSYDKETHTFTVEDIKIFKQECTATTTKLDESALAKFLTELVKSGENPADWFLWWHSHVDMKAYFSGTDTDTIETSKEYATLLSLVVNRAGDKVARLDTHSPYRMTEDVDVLIDVMETPAEILEEIDAEVKAHVTDKKYPAYHAYNGGPATQHVKGYDFVDVRDIKPTYAHEEYAHEEYAHEGAVDLYGENYDVQYFTVDELIEEEAILQSDYKDSENRLKQIETYGPSYQGEYDDVFSEYASTGERLLALKEQAKRIEDGTAEEVEEVTLPLPLKENVK